jgi:hypothetical protein
MDAQSQQPKQRRPHYVAGPSGFQAGATLICSLACAAGAFGQEVNAPPALNFSGLVPGPPLAGTSALAATPPSPPASRETPQPLLQWGPIEFHPHLLYRLTYADGLEAQAIGQGTKTIINELSPGMLLVLGSHWSLDYTPTLRYYSSSRFQDGVDHSVSLNGATAYQDWTLGFKQSFFYSDSQPLVETGGQISQEQYVTALNAGYSINHDLSLELGLDQNFRFTGQGAAGQSFADVREWSTMDWVNYMIAPRLIISSGAGLTYDNVLSGSDIVAENLEGRVTWHPTQKLGMTLSGGFEESQFLSAGATDLLTPIFAASAFYQPFEHTILSLDASRSVSPSYFLNSVNENTSVTGSLQQRLFARLYFGVSGGYRITTYLLTSGGHSQSREDDGTFVSVRLSTQFLKRATAAVFYQANQNRSSSALYQYSSTQVGLELGYRL